jgi:hypothetical protein
MLVALIIFIAFALISVGLIAYEAKHSVAVDPKAPFLHGDYDEDNDPTARHQEVFCKHCQFSKDGIVCLKDTVAEITDERVANCKRTSMFIAK